MEPEDRLREEREEEARKEIQKQESLAVALTTTTKGVVYDSDSASYLQHINDNTYDGSGLPKELVINYGKMNLLPIPLNADGIPSPYTTDYYSLEQTLDDDFKNIGTRLGSMIIDGKRVFLNVLLIRSEEVFTILAQEGFIERMAKETFVVFSGGQTYYREIFWLSTIKNPSIPASLCKAGYEFEIKTGRSEEYANYNYAILPPSIINGHHYQSIGRQRLTTSAVDEVDRDRDKIYSFLIKTLEDCLIHDDAELSIPDHLLQKGISYIKYSQPYSRVTINGIEVPFRVFDSWCDTQESIYQALIFALEGFEDILIAQLIVLLADEHRKRRRFKELELELPNINIEPPKPKYDIDLVNTVSSILQKSHDQWQKSSEIWNRLIEELEGSESNSNTFHSSRFGTIYKNST